MLEECFAWCAGFWGLPLIPQMRGHEWVTRSEWATGCGSRALVPQRARQDCSPGVGSNTMRRPLMRVLGGSGMGIGESGNWASLRDGVPREAVVGGGLNLVAVAAGPRKPKRNRREEIDAFEVALPPLGAGGFGRGRPVGCGVAIGGQAGPVVRGQAAGIGGPVQRHVGDIIRHRTRGDEAHMDRGIGDWRALRELLRVLRGKCLTTREGCSQLFRIQTCQASQVHVKPLLNGRRKILRVCL